MNSFIEFCYHQHDVVCNQKYDNNLPYSFHLKMVIAQAYKFDHLMPKRLSEMDDVFFACAGHDLIEDARLTYNDIVGRAGERVANIIYLCTEEKGRNRAERKSDKFYEELAKDDLAVFVKLCDIMANSLYSTLSNSTMLEKQRKEWCRISEKLYLEKYHEMFKYLDNIYKLN